VSKNLTNPFFDGCFYKPKLMDLYLLEGTTLAKISSYYRWQLFSHGQLVSNSTHSFFAYLTSKGNYFQQLWMEKDNYPKHPSFPHMWIISHLLLQNPIND